MYQHYGLRLASTLLVVATIAWADDVATVRQRMLSTYGWPANTTAAINSTAAVALSLAASLNASGMWLDINYNDYNDRTIWATAVHMQRVSTMAAALSVPGSPVINQDNLFSSTRLALNAWYQHDWQNSNWWWDILEMPQVHSISFLMLDLLPKGSRAFPSAYELDRATNFSLRAQWWNASLGYEVTAANLAWMVQAQLLRGVWPSQVNLTALNQGFTRMWAEIKIVDWDPTNSDGTNQGVQVDRSFHMHSAQIQTAQYGQDYAQDELAFISIAEGTQFAVGDEGVQLLCSYLADGMAWQSAGMGFDWATSGRALDRNSWGAVSKVNLPTSLMRMLASRCNVSTASDVAAFADRVDNIVPIAPLLGHRHFWTSDYASHKRANWTAGWHGTSSRTVPNECGNGENLLGMYEAQGLLNIMNNECELGMQSTGTVSEGPVGWGCGMEYVGLFPLLDWTALNGATALVDLPSPPCGPSPQCCWHPAVSAGNRTFVGGVSDGVYGATVMDTAYLTLTAKKSTFFFDSAVIAMGVNISESGSSRVRTALASRFLKAGGSGLILGFANGTSATLEEGGPFSFPSGSAGSGAMSWAFADGVGWLPALAVGGGQAVYPQADGWAGIKTEAWDIIGVYPGNVTGRTLSLTMQHDNAAKGAGDSFAYAVLPFTSMASTQAAAADPLAVLGIDPLGLINSRAVQGATQVSSAELVMQAVFWSHDGGMYAYAGQGWDVTITVDHACLLTVTLESGTSAVTVGVSNPDSPDLAVTVGVSAPGKSGCGGLVFNLNPAGQPNYLGQSQVQTCILT